MSKMKETEEWKSLDFLGFPDYQVSNFGRVKSFKRGKEKILKQIKKSDGYLSVGLYRNGKLKNITIHRLVCLAFLENKYNLPCINHKDENKENNHINNLEYCDIRYNNNYGTRNERIGDSIKGRKVLEETKIKISIANKGKKLSEEHKQKIRITHKGKPNYKHRKPILQYTKDMIFICEWDSATSVNIELNITRENIIACCKHKRKTCGGYIWRYKE